MFYCLFSICICHPRGPPFDLSPPVSASPGSRWPVDWQLRSDIWWDEASTGAPRRQKQTSGVFSPLWPRWAAEQRHPATRLIRPLDDARRKRIFFSTLSTILMPTLQLLKTNFWSMLRTLLYFTLLNIHKFEELLYFKVHILTSIWSKMAGLWDTYIKYGLLHRRTNT